jgi:ubiquinone/menaquinone biosynthesis C-methylase UbiE
LDGQARYDGVPYADWKAALFAEFITPNLSPQADVLEIAPGHGRWSELMVNQCRTLTLVDLSPTCIEFCRSRLEKYNNVAYQVTDGKTLTDVADTSIDFLWSFDSSVHMSPEVIQAYLHETHRVLRAGGKAVLHHAGRRDMLLGLGFLKDWGGLGRDAYKILSMGKLGDDDGWRSDVSRELIRRLAERAGLTVESQVQTWGQNGKFGLLRYGDWMTTLRKLLENQVVPCNANRSHS